MHELAIAEALIEQVATELDRAGQNGAVKQLELAVGKLSGVHCDSLRFAFELLSPGTPAEGAELLIREPPAMSRCHQCGAATEITEIVIDCPQCGSPEIVIEEGRELLLETIEIRD
ncbi:MAG: hydrogenase maturation nickel metallochaperone HypA [Thermoguttaceae bacterium]